MELKKKLKSDAQMCPNCRKSLTKRRSRSTSRATPTSATPTSPTLLAVKRNHEDDIDAGGGGDSGGGGGGEGGGGGGCGAGDESFDSTTARYSGLISTLKSFVESPQLQRRNPVSPSRNGSEMPLSQHRDPSS